MKTMIVISKMFVAEHRGEEYDEIIFVTDEPDTSNISGEANRIMEAIKKTADSEGITITVAAAPLYYVVVENLAFKCKESGINVVCPWVKQ